MQHLHLDGAREHHAAAAGIAGGQREVPQPGITQGHEFGLRQHHHPVLARGRRREAGGLADGGAAIDAQGERCHTATGRSRDHQALPGFIAGDAVVARDGREAQRRAAHGKDHRIGGPTGERCTAGRGQQRGVGAQALLG